MRTDEDSKSRAEMPICSTVSQMSERTSDLLLLHYKSKFSATSIAEILSMDEQEVKHSISKFAELFTTEDNLMNVVDSLAKMKKNRTVATAANAASTPTEQSVEIAELRRQLKEAQIKAEAYQEMIILAEQTFKIPIRKKSGAK